MRPWQNANKCGVRVDAYMHTRKQTNMNANKHTSTQTHIRTHTYTCTITDSRPGCRSRFQAHIFCCNDGLCLSPSLPLPPSPSPSTFLSPLLPFFLSPSVSSSVYLLPSPSPGRRSRFPTLRQWNGLSGFTKRKESEYDCFGAGHSSTSISAALGVCLFSNHQESLCIWKRTLHVHVYIWLVSGAGHPDSAWRVSMFTCMTRDTCISKTHIHFTCFGGELSNSNAPCISLFSYTWKETKCQWKETYMSCLCTPIVLLYARFYFHVCGKRCV